MDLVNYVQMNILAPLLTRNHVSILNVMNLITDMFVLNSIIPTEVVRHVPSMNLLR